jgi:hypothetical protein
LITTSNSDNNVLSLSSEIEALFKPEGVEEQKIFNTLIPELQLKYIKRNSERRSICNPCLRKEMAESHTIRDEVVSRA